MPRLYGITVDAQGYVYVVDRSNGRIQKFDSSGKFLTKWGKNGKGDGEFNIPESIAIGPSGKLYVADYGNDRIQVLNSSTGELITKWAVPGPLQIAVDSLERIYVSSYSQTIKVFNSTGGLQETFEDFSCVGGIAFDDDGRVYVVDREESTVYVFAPREYISPPAGRLLTVTIESPYSLGSIHGMGDYSEGTEVTVALYSPSIEYANGTRIAFSGWTTNITWENPDTSSTTFTFTLKSNVKITANWERQYYVSVETTYGKPQGEGWYTTGSQATCSVSTIRVEKDLFTSYVFEGWKINGELVSTSPTYSFTVTKPVSLTAVWRTETNQTTIGAIIGVILVILVTTIVITLRRRKQSS